MQTLSALLISTGYVGFLIYNSIYRNIFDILLYTPETKKHIITIAVFFISTSILLLLRLLRLLRSFLSKKDPGIFMSFLITSLVKIMLHFKLAYGVIFDFIGPRYTQYLIIGVKKIVDAPEYYKKIIIFFEVLPRLSIIIIFLCELHIGRLHYFFYALLLQLLPLLFNFFVFILEDIGPRVKKELDVFIQFDVVHDITKFDFNHKSNLKDIQCHKICLKPEFSHIDFDDFMTRLYYPILFIPGQMSQYFLPLHIKIKNIIMVLYLLILFFGWLYIICYSFIF